MLSKEDNELLTRTGSNTPMGKLLRRFWAPVLLADDLPEPDCDPVRVKVMGEFFAAFRDTSGRLGFLDARCPHRGADLSYGINEEGGLRCRQCFWKFDVTGKIIDLPMEPADSPLWTEVRARSCKVIEYGGVIWAYLGPDDDTPDLPEFEWTHVPPENRYLSRFLVECNYMQAVEGGLDAARLMALERLGKALGAEHAAAPATVADEPPHQVQSASTDYGLMIGTAVGEGGDASDVQVTHWLMPFYTTAPSEIRGVLEGLAWVPVDDERTMAFAVTYSPKRPLSQRVLNQIRRGKRVHPVLEQGTLLRKKNKDNGYVADGKKPAGWDFKSRFDNTLELAIACQESMGAIVDRSQENLGPNDVAVEAARKVLIDAAIDLMEGTVPAIVHKGEAYRVRSTRATLDRGASLADDATVRKAVAAEV